MRETGYYWVFVDSVWEIAYFDGIWERNGRDAGYSDEYFCKIDERKIERKE